MDEIGFKKTDSNADGIHRGQSTNFYRGLLTSSLLLSAVICIFVLVKFSVEIPYSINSMSTLQATTLQRMFVKPRPTTKTTATSVSTDFTLVRSGGYESLPYFGEDASSLLTYSHLESFSTIVEPYASMELQVSGEYADSASYYFYFSVCPSGSESTSTDCENGELSYDSDSGDSASIGVTIECVPYSEYEFQVEVYSTSDSSLISTTDLKAICMYVRREIRTLSKSDLQTTMDAMYVLWSTTEEEGQSLYGSQFHNSTYFVEAHHFNAAWQDADHIHEGMGFLTQHVKMTNLFEAAVQAVDSSVSLPYWDFTIESESGTVVQKSTIFSKEMFGSIPVPVDNRWGFVYENDDIVSAAIPDGRWAYIKADLTPSKFSGTQLDAAYSYLRAPWNMNPSPYVSRFSSYSSALPGCDDYYRWAKNSDLTDFMSDSPYGPHAATHGVIGSVYGCDLLTPLREAGLIDAVTDQLALCSKWGFYMKELYRLNYIAPQASCERPADDSSSVLTYDGMSCGFTCNAKTYGLMGQQLSKIISSMYVHEGGLTDDQWNVMRDFVCDGDGYKVFVGDHLESASPSDPSFWPIHPTMERLLQAKLMSGGFDTYDWSSDASAGYVCDKSSCYEYEEGAKDEYPDCCYGHYENDQLLDFVAADKSQGFGLTNAQVMAYTDPTGTLSFSDAANGGSKISGYNMTYVYDNFEWSHCTTQDFDSLFTDMASRKRRLIYVTSDLDKS